MGGNHKFQGNNFGKSTCNVISELFSKGNKKFEVKIMDKSRQNRNIVIFWVTVTNISTSERKLRRKTFKGLRGALD